MEAHELHRIAQRQVLLVDDDREWRDQRNRLNQMTVDQQNHVPERFIR